MITMQHFLLGKNIILRIYHRDLLTCSPVHLNLSAMLQCFSLTTKQHQPAYQLQKPSAGLSAAKTTTSHVCILESGWSEYKLDLVSYTNTCNLRCQILEDIREPIIQRPDRCMIYQEYMRSTLARKVSLYQYICNQKHRSNCKINNCIR